MVDVMDGLLPAFNKRGKTKPIYITHIDLAEQNTALVTEHLFSPLMPGCVSSLLVDRWVAREDSKQWEGKESCKVITTEEDNQVLDLQSAQYCAYLYSQKVTLFPLKYTLWEEEAYHKKSSSHLQN